MARPKKIRYIDGVALEENLYPDNKKRPGHYRYLRPDGTGRFFTADTVHQANAAAKKANNGREGYSSVEKKSPELTLIGRYTEDFITYRELQSPNLKEASSWKNRRYALRNFAKAFGMSPLKLSREHIQEWWDGLTFYQQKLRHTECRRFFNYAMGRGIFKQLEYNPFTTADDRPRLYLRDRPNRSRSRLELHGFWRIYRCAGNLGYEGLQIAMGLSLLTFMREGDILSLNLDHLQGDLLKKVINKSASQKGHLNAVRLQWNTETYKPLKQLINRGRELSLKNQHCPYLVSYMPKIRDTKNMSKIKTHIAQLTKERLCEQFRDAMNTTGLWNTLPDNRTPPTFHEIRSLADALAAANRIDIKLIQQAMAHSSEAQTLMYQAEHDLPHDDVNIHFTEKMLGGDFK